MKNKNTPIIPELTRSGYQAFFENYSDEWVFEENFPLSDKEARIVQYLRSELGEEAQIIAVRRVEKPDGVKMPDLIVNGHKVEIKEVSSARSVENQTKKAIKQGTDSVIYEIVSDSDEKTQLLRSEIKKRVAKFGINNFISIQENSTAASYARHDSAIHNLILSQRAKKVKVSSTDFNKLGINTVQKYEKTHESIKTPGISPKLSKKPPEYWQKRSLQRTVAAERQALPYIRKLREEYARSSNRSIDNVRRIYENYFSKAGFDRQKLREIVPSGELSKYLKEVRKLGIELPDNYKYRVSREEFAQAQLWLEAKKLGVFENQISTELYSKIISQSFTQTFGDYGVNFAKLNTEAMNQILNSKFHGENFSTRIWGRTDRLADELQAKLAFAVAKGQSWEKTSREIRERFGVSQSSAERLIRTETNYFENSAEIEAYSELGVKEFEFLAALDGRTSEICRHHHGKRFKVKDAKAGVNTPPLHPNCRSTVVAVVPELENTANIDIEKQKEPVEENSIGVNIKKPPVKQASESEVKNLTLSDSLSGALKTDDVRQKVINKINSMPKTHKAIWAKFNSELKFIDAPNGGDSFSSLGSIVKVRTAGIIDGSTELTNHTRKPFEILLHEYGHGFDHRANRGSYKSISAELKLSNNKTLGETILSEANSRLKSQEGKSLFYRRQSLMKEIKSEIENGYSKNDLLSIFDLYGGAAFKDGMKVFGVGHEPTYWSGKKSLMGVKLSKEHIEAHRAKALGSEGFAEMFSATARKDKKEIELYEKYLPESFAMFNELLERISKL